MHVPPVSKMGDESEGEMDNRDLPSATEVDDETDPSAWLFALTPEAFEQLSASSAELHESDADSPLAGLLAAWLQIERSKQSLMELLA